MTTLSSLLKHEHHRCDEAFTEAENAVAASDWPQASAAFARFRTATIGHFDKEEKTLFPALAEVTGMAGGPLHVMRLEHEQMRGTLAQWGTAIEVRDQAAALGWSETLMMVMQQHNHKEEHIVYAMADEALAGQTERLLRALAPRP